MPDKSQSSGRSDQTRQQLMQAALEVFGEYGPQAATTRDIANRAGQNIAAIAYHFQSKEGLYLAVAGWMSDYVRQTYRPLVAEIEAFMQRPPQQQSAEQLMEYIRRGILTFSRLMTRSETLNLSRIVSREQLSPTDAYPIIHQQVIDPMHRLLTMLIARYTGMDQHHPKVIVHTHALIGEVLSFRVARETILLRAGWQDIGNEETTLIQQVLMEHLDILLNGLRVHHARQIKE
ncbi:MULTISPECIES: transcriptional regulator CecR [unclassified Brenneria]|uniref:transcriptional regulator CecR n=1 Tax=unclassified Brenneria TaxID=2634434 RepID=UPI0029C2314F|nr:MULTISPECIES: transcriptional regulator CecR [unclassified Brenneria]MDX5627254.1 transcriptional regulator CecR [Brenneria sp. L3-3Z]MDX5694590.1 transcriptional regulator CecR [Brenneria sp. L4-2C]MEE3661802.1 transcriptional regulator CecR [Brenneria sp. g21c3]